jgi:hypothetical protein
MPGVMRHPAAGEGEGEGLGIGRPIPGSAPAAGSGRRATVVVVMVLAAALAVWVAWGFWGFSYDDNFITYRYARNVAELGRLEYNPGERVMGTSAPGYALLLGGLVWAGGGRLSAPEWGTLLAVASLVVVTLVLRQLLGPARPVVRDGAAALFALLAFTCQWNVEMLGGEALPVLALVAAGAWLALGRREVLGGALLGLAALLRLDAALAAVCVGGVLLARRRRLPLGLAAASGLPVAAFVGWLAATFGSVMPHTMAVKRSELAAGAHYTLDEWHWLRRAMPQPAAGLLLVLAAGALVTLVPLALAAWRRRGGPAGEVAAPTPAEPAALAPAAPGAAAAAAPGAAAAAAPVAAAAAPVAAAPAAPVAVAPAAPVAVAPAAPVAVGGAPAAAVPAAAAALGAWVVLHEVAYHLLGVPFAPWYEIHLLNALLALAAVGTLRGAAWVARVAPSAAARGVTGAAVAGALVLGLAPGRYVAAHFGTAPDPRYAGYVAAGEYLRTHSTGMPTAAAVEIGFFGYASRARILDLVGLVSPRALAARTTGAAAGGLARLVEEERPDFLLDATLFRQQYLGPIVDDPKIAGAYRQVASFPDGRGAGLAIRLLRRTAAGP